MDLLFGVALVLGVMILVHEWGHFIAARIFGVRVDVFSIGFGPRLFGWKRGATDYRVGRCLSAAMCAWRGRDPAGIGSGAGPRNQGQVKALGQVAIRDVERSRACPT